MRYPFGRCLRELLWRTCHPGRAARALSEAAALLGAGTVCPSARLAQLRAFPWWEVRNLAVKLTALDPAPSAVVALGDVLADGAEVGIVRRNAAAALAGRDSSPATAEILRRCLRDPYCEVRREAVCALANMAPRSQETFDALRAAAARERSFEVRAAVPRALAATGNRDALPLLAALADDPFWLVRVQSAVALAELGASTPSLRDEIRAILARIERLSAGLTGRIVLAERLAATEALLAAEQWPVPAQLAPLYLTSEIPWTRQ